MGGDIQAIGARQSERLDPNAFKPKPGGNLDTVSQGNTKKDNTSALKKIVTYKPIKLNFFGSDIQSSVTQRKQASDSREAQSAIVKEKVQTVRQQNPFSNPIERQAVIMLILQRNSLSQSGGHA